VKNKKQKNQIDFDKEYRRLGVFIERVDSNVGLIAEQQGDIKKILDSHTEILDSHTEILDSHTEMIGSIKMNIEVIKEDITFIKGGLKRKVDAEEFLVLERRVALLEKRR